MNDKLHRRDKAMWSKYIFRGGHIDCYFVDFLFMALFLLGSIPPKCAGIHFVKNNNNG